ncbi:glycosyl hydrolase 53 family protein [Anaerosporobacter faecicola]|uniref:glycosyl hydrolase 53 family protein n=1 Tax=Anaerosporobacter faecicola TaxID=2718714 RepID=UPI0014395C78|nr:glycosyl hydrolase 53 family protein [Anaerosporobacter faecicola]
MAEFYKGMDISGLPELEAEAVKMKDLDGTVMEPFELITKYGVNAIRLRLWNNPEYVEEAKGFCNLTHTIAMAKRIKAHHLNFMLDFHYSDFWADPGKQVKPKDWENLSFDELEEAVYTYTRDTLLALQAEDVLPDIVQIGNEIRSGLLFPEGELPDYEHMVRLVNAGIRGARSVADAETMKVMIHLDQGGRFFYLKEWFDKSIETGLLDFDIIGLSYYPFWHGTFHDLQQSLMNLIHTYQKPIMVVETAHAWRKSSTGFIDESQEKIAGIAATPEGQQKVLDLVMNIVASIPGQMGCGVYYWEPLCIPVPGEGGWSDNMGLLNEEGRILPGIKSFGFTREQLRVGEPAKVYEPEDIQITVDEEPGLPEQLPVLFYDGTIQKKHVEWQIEQKQWEMGEHRITGNMDSIPFPVFCKVVVLKEVPKEMNLLRDVNWNEGLTQWEVQKSEEHVVVQLSPDFIDPFPAPPVNSLRIESPKNFTFAIHQQVMIQREGYYTLQVEYKGTDTTNVEIHLFIETMDGISETMIHPTEHEWGVFQVKPVFCKPQMVTVGIRVSAPPVYGMIRKFSFSHST